MTTLRMGTAVTLGDLELIPVEEVQLDSNQIAGGIMVFAAKAPAAVVVRSPTGSRVLNLDGEETPLDDLLRDVPGLRGWIERGPA